MKIRINKPLSLSTVCQNFRCNGRFIVSFDPVIMIALRSGNFPNILGFCFLPIYRAHTDWNDVSTLTKQINIKQPI